MQIKPKLHKQKSDIINSRLLEINAKIPTTAKYAEKHGNGEACLVLPTVQNVTHATAL